MAEQALVAATRTRELLRGIFGAAERWSWHAGARMSFQINVRVAQQRKNWMVKRRGRQLDLTPGRSLAVLRNYPSQNLELHISQLGLVGFRERALLAHEAVHSGVVVQIERIHPGELVPDLQIEIVLVRICSAGIPFGQQLRVARDPLDHSSARRVEILREHRRALMAR